MAVPTITQVSPAVGHSGGGTLVQITGTNFQLAPAAPASPNGKVPKAAPTVRVLFDGVPATLVRVFSETTLYVTTPRHAANDWSFVFQNGEQSPAPGKHPKLIPPGATVVQTGFGTVDVTLENIDAAGALIPGETVTVEDAYTFKRPALGHAGIILRTVLAFEQILRNDITYNVAFNPSVDYDSKANAVLGFIQLASKEPGIAITEVVVAESEASTNEPIYVDGSNGLVLVRRPPKFKDISFTLVLVADRLHELTSLGELVQHHFDTNEGLPVPRDLADPSRGVLVFPYMTDPRGVRYSGRIGRTDSMTALFSGVIQQVPMEAPPGLDYGTFADAPEWISHAGTIDITRKLAQAALTPLRYVP